MQLRQVTFSGSLSPEITQRELDHRVLSRRAAAEGIVLLKNDGVLPLSPGSKTALYGGGARYTVKGGTGSGAVNNRSNVSIYEGLKNAGLIITSEEWLNDYDRRYQTARENWIRQIYDLSEPGNFDSLYRAHATHSLIMPKGDIISNPDHTDTAVYVVSRISGEGADRKTEKGDYFLTDTEYEELKQVSSVYIHTVLVLNIGGIIDLSFMEEIRVDALVLLSQAGMEGGNALGDMLTGKVNPSGRLTDTWAFSYTDYPSSATFSHNNGNVIEEKYTDSIYVGYRYFDSFSVKPRYPFGYGLSYTSFSYAAESVTVENARITVRIRVTNTGTCAGKEVIQLYVSCPQGRLVKEKKRLVGFGKTALLEAGASEVLSISFWLPLLESYHGGTSSYYMEAGNYYLFAGTSAEELQPAAVLTLPGTVCLEKLTPICPLLDALKEIRPSDTQTETWRAEMDAVFTEKLPRLSLEKAVQDYLTQLAAAPAVQPDVGAEELVKKLTLEEKAALVCGQPGTGTAEFIGNAADQVPGAAGETTSILKENYHTGNMILADGPAGVRLQQRYEENPENGRVYKMTRYQFLENRLFGTEFLHEGAISHYQFCSAIPVGTLLAQTFDLELIREVGDMIGREMEEFGVTLWLAPGMNIHRNPLCGRNFEYYSEDPLVSGMMAAALTKGVQQHPGIGTTIKHFACNNQEENRRGVSSIVSERALREIYLKGFEIAVRESQPMAIMTFYNKVNGVHTANSYDLCTTAARDEWGFQGFIMTDWTTTNQDGGSSAAKCVQAGNDLIMPGTFSDIQEIIDAVQANYDLFLNEAYLDECATRMISVIRASNCYENAENYSEKQTLFSFMKSEP